MTGLIGLSIVLGTMVLDIIGQDELHVLLHPFNEEELSLCIVTAKKVT